MEEEQIREALDAHWHASAIGDVNEFVHIMDIEGNKIKLWEPDDLAYEKMGMKMGLKTTK